MRDEVDEQGGVLNGDSGVLDSLATVAGDDGGAGLVDFVGDHEAQVYQGP